MAILKPVPPVGLHGGAITWHMAQARQPPVLLEKPSSQKEGNWLLNTIMWLLMRVAETLLDCDPHSCWPKWPLFLLEPAILMQRP